MSAKNLRMYIERQSAPSEFLSWAVENEDLLDENSLQSTLEQSENNIRTAKVKYNKAAGGTINLKRKA